MLKQDKTRYQPDLEDGEGSEGKYNRRKAQKEMMKDLSDIQGVRIPSKFFQAG